MQHIKFDFWFLQNDETTTTMVHTIPESMTSQKRRVRQKPSQNLTSADLSGITSVVVQQHHELQDENAVAVSGIPGKIFAIWLIKSGIVKTAFII